MTYSLYGFGGTSNPPGVIVGSGSNTGSGYRSKWEQDETQTRELQAIHKLLILVNVFLFLIVLGVWALPFLAA